MLVSFVLLLLIPLTYVAMALVPSSRLVATGQRSSIAPVAAGIALLLSLVVGGRFLAMGATATVVSLGAVPPSLGPIALSLRLDALTVAMLLLVNSIGVIILRFSRRYLDGEPAQPRYFRAFLATLSAVSLLVVTNNLAVLALAWTVTSVTLHQLLEFYGDRPSALIAAHKKFLMARVADVAIVGAFVLLWRATGTLEMDALFLRADQWRANDAFPSSVQMAGVLLAIGVILRSAQLPFHGWLIQVMEAPTPVSALLHAGIVNIGGFVMIRLADLMGHLAAAQLLLVVMGTLTASLAGLVMMTRVSVKVALAWSTCAQMGFMLLECGLGAYTLAFLHLVAHSLYKAHAFLSSGRTVETSVRRSMILGRSAAAPRSFSAWLIGGAGAVLAMVLVMQASGMAFTERAAQDPALVAMALIFALALAPALARALVARDRASFPIIGAAVVLAIVYAVAHWGAGYIVTAVAASTNTVRAGAILVALAFVVLFIVQATVLTAPRGGFARAFYPACFAGFYLDEIFTRLTFRIWPPTSVRRAARERALARGAA